LLCDAVTPTLAASQTIAVRAMLVHTIDEDAARSTSVPVSRPRPLTPPHLMLLIKDIAAALDAARESGRW
jgi:hypothetical protein